MRKSEVSKWGLNELCCKRTVHRWNRLELRFPLMYGTGMPHSTQKLSMEGALSGTVVVSNYSVPLLGLPIGVAFCCEVMHELDWVSI